MEKAVLEKQVVAITNNKVGMFAEVTSCLAEAKINIRAICAWSMQDKAHFSLLTNNNAEALAALNAKGFEVNEEAVVTVNLDDKIGSAANIAQKLKGAGINLDYIYGTSCGCPKTTALLVLVSKENAKIVDTLKG